MEWNDGMKQAVCEVSKKIFNLIQEANICMSLGVEYNTV